MRPLIFPAPSGGRAPSPRWITIGKWLLMAAMVMALPSTVLASCPSVGREITQEDNLAVGTTAAPLVIALEPCEQVTFTITTKRSLGWAGSIGLVQLQNSSGQEWEHFLVTASGQGSGGPDEKVTTFSAPGRTYGDRSVHQVVITADSFGNFEYRLVASIVPRPGHNDAGQSVATARTLAAPACVRGNVLGGLDPGHYYKVFVGPGQSILLTTLFAHRGYGSQIGRVDLYSQDGQLLDDGFLSALLEYDQDEVRSRPLVNTSALSRWFVLRVHGDSSFGALYREVLYALSVGSDTACPLDPVDTDGDGIYDDGDGVGLACRTGGSCPACSGPPRVKKSQLNVDSGHLPLRDWVSVDSKLPNLYLEQWPWKPTVSNVPLTDQNGSPLTYQLVMVEDGGHEPPTAGPCRTLYGPFAGKTYFSKWLRPTGGGNPANTGSVQVATNKVRHLRGRRYWWTFATRDSEGRINMGEFRSIFIMPKAMPYEGLTISPPNDPLLGNRARIKWAQANGAVCVPEGEHVHEPMEIEGVRYDHDVTTCTFTRSVSPTRQTDLRLATWDNRRSLPQRHVLTNCNEDDVCTALADVYEFDTYTPSCLVPESASFWESVYTLFEVVHCAFDAYELVHGHAYSSEAANACALLLNSVATEVDELPEC